MDKPSFVRANTVLKAPSLVPEIRLYLADDAMPLWQKTEDELEQVGLPPPYWAFAWAGGQGLARHLLDSPETVRGKRVLDFASGSGVVAIAASLAGAAEVAASEIDPYALAAIRLNAALNGCDVAVTAENQVGRNGGWDVVLAGDVCYEKPMAEAVFAWLSELARCGATVLLGDPGRTYLPKQGLEKLGRYAVQTTRELEDSDLRNAIIWRVTGEASSVATESR